MTAKESAKRVRQVTEMLSQRLDALLLMQPDHSDEVADIVLSAWSDASNVPHSDRVLAARVAQRLLAGLGQKLEDQQDAYAPEDICWQIGLMQDYELDLLEGVS